MSQAAGASTNKRAIDAESKITRIKDAIREWIERGEVAVGEQLPSEPALVERFGVSRGTVRESIASLAAEGLLSRVHGKGTFVIQRPVRHRTVAVVMPYLFVSPNSPLRAGTEVIPSLTQAIESACRRHGMSIMLFLNNNDAAIERENLSRILQLNVDAAIVNYLGGERNLDCLRQIQTAGLPLVTIDVRADELDCVSISTDNATGAYEATRELYRAGARRVLYMTGPVTNSALRDRRAGYLSAIDDLGLDPEVYAIEKESDGPGDEQGLACDLALQALCSTPEPLGVLTADAVILTGVWRAAQRLGLRTDRYVLACFDDPALDVLDGPRIIKVVQPFQEIGRLSVEAIEEELSGSRQKKHTSRRIELPPKIEYLGLTPCAHAVVTDGHGRRGALV